MQNFVMRFPEGKPKAMTFSYDDGVVEDLKLIELMKKYGIKATFNYNSSHFAVADQDATLVLRDGHLTSTELKTISTNPQFEIACHGHTHPYYTFLPQAAATNDILTNRKELERITGKIIKGFAYPSISAFNDVSESALKSVGIVYARLATRNKNFSLPQNWYRWEPTCHHKEAIEIYKEFSQADVFLSNGLVMYVWGHSFEFARENNWEIIEELFKLCHLNPDIWFATNMEIYNYANDFKKLVFSADGSKAYNPTATDLWGVIDAKKRSKGGKLIKIPAGETVSLLL